MVTSNSPSKLLRRTLQANAAFSALSGIIAIAGAKLLSSLLGVNVSSLLIGLGIALVAYAAALSSNACRENIKLQEAWLAVVLDAAWVIGSVMLIFAGALSTTGNWLAAIVADVVLIFAVLQFLGIRRLQQQKLAKATT
jgi:O-antigen ligase